MDSPFPAVHPLAANATFQVPARIAKRLFNFYVFGNFHIALCAVALTLTTQAIFRLELLRIELISLLCFSAGLFSATTCSGYLPAFQSNSFHRGCRRHRWNTQHRLLLTALSLLAAIAFVWSGSRIYLRTQIMALIPAALSFAYAFPIIRTGRKWIQLREIPGIKIFVIAITWACSCALLPIVSVHRGGEPWFSLAAVLWALVCGILVLSLTIPFDIRDLRYDAGELRTLPALLGVKRSTLVAIAGLAVSAAVPWITWQYMDNGTGMQAVAYSAWCAVASFFIYKSSPERSVSIIFSFAIDGLLLLLLGMIWTAGAL